MIVAIITTAITTTTTPEHLADAIELLLQRRRFGRRVVEHAGDASHLGLHAGRDDHRPSATVGHRRAAEDHVVAVAETHLAGDRRDVLRRPAGSRRSAPLPPSAARSTGSPAHRPESVSPSSTTMMSPGTSSAAATLVAVAVANHVRVRRRHLPQRRDR